ncbi:beta strand repeat-containing protein [Novosphingobium cyanobacteriorum]|uniref:Filamentous hemagglutinin N-terminal domain-containing protein n=1 Tax=Novosphingobium cyanobacteriorum TaxID=3024215 RepID=A0ABT6CK95_9SPHN|nr:filamentous hemagglutinin N-terminal domain-containing protein [Novosphingobium cyanobacteriorum]MDF8334349.1 filamentous hemagglutinin N-terminal domain-containing protein [Novosphingobium cyanobacteriorum]
MQSLPARAALALVAFHALPVMAQTATVIVPDAAASALSTGTTALRTGRVTTIDGGTLSGGNLFHSFTSFNLAQGDTARWTTTLVDPARVTTVVNRVTGGDVSRIDGRIDSNALPNAAFFFINPAGVVLGPSARIDVPAAAHFSTAQSLKFADGSEFAIATPGGSRLSLASPQSFGFLGGQGNITILTRSQTSMPASLDLSAANVRIADARVSAPSLRIAAVGQGTAEVPLTGVPAQLSGHVTITDSRLTAGAGGLQIAGGTISTVFTTLAMRTTDAVPTANLTLKADRIALQASEVSTLSTGAAPSAAIRIDGRRVIIADGTMIRTRATRGGSAGSIAVDAASLLVDTAAITSSTARSGHAGAIDIGVSGNADLRNTEVSSTALTGSTGNAGAVTLRTGTMTVFGSAIASNVFDRTLGRAGLVSVTADALRLDGGTLIGSSTLGSGAGGSIAVTVKGGLRLYTQSAISADTQGGGAGGNVQVDAGTVTVDDALISADAYAQGNAGALSVIADSVTISNGGNISSDARGQGAGGAVGVNARRVTVDSAFISADSYDSGNGGTITLSAGKLVVENEGKVRSASFGAGSAGGIVVAAQSLLVNNTGSISSDSFDTGSSGTVAVEAERLTVANNSYITSDGVSAGGAGAVSVKAGQLLLMGSFVGAETYQDGASGEVAVVADSIVLDDGSIASRARPGSSGNAGTIRITAGSVSARNLGFITSETFGPGQAGDIVLTADRLLLQDDSFIASNSNGAGTAGSVSVTAGRASLASGAEITSSANDAGSGGDVSVTADLLTLANGQIGTSAARTSTGDAGDVSVNAGRLDIVHGAITSDGLGRGGAGTIAVNAGALAMDGGAISGFSAARARGSGSVLLTVDGALSMANGATITASSANAGTSGTVNVTADVLTATGEGTAITTSNTWPGVAGQPAGAAGAAGMIDLAARRITIADGAVLSSNSLSGPAGDIAVAMPRTGIFLLVGSKAPGVVTTSSGPGTGGRIIIRNPLALVSNGGSILAQGQLGGALLELGSRYFIQSADRANLIAVDGAIRIDANVYDVSAGTAPSSLDYLDASKVLLGQCASARATGETSRIGWRNTGPYAARPIRTRITLQGLPATQAPMC